MAIMQVSNCRMASKIAGESGSMVVAADAALCFVRENAIFLWLDSLMPAGTESNVASWI